jgi:hypothetical protein
VQAVSASGVRGTAFNDQPQLNTSVATNAEQVDGETFKQPKEGAYCDGTSETNHPEGDKLADEFDVDYTEIMDWFCQGYGFGEISQAYKISQLKGISAEEVFAMRASGMGWGKIKQFYGLIGKGSHSKNGNGNGNGSGNANNGNKGNNGNGKGNNGNHGNGKANGHSQH